MAKIPLPLYKLKKRSQIAGTLSFILQIQFYEVPPARDS